MKLVIGIGNPGKKYQKNRHNVGFMAIDALASKYQNDISRFKLNKKLACYMLHTTNYILAKPQTFMNESGQTVSKIVNQYKIISSDIWVIHDDLDLHLGQYKIQKRKGPKVHNGLLSIYEKLGTRDFWHVRVGVDNREKIENRKWKMENYMNGKDYVLMNFNANELKVIKLTIDKVVENLIERITNN